MATSIPSRQSLGRARSPCARSRSDDGDLGGSNLQVRILAGPTSEDTKADKVWRRINRDFELVFPDGHVPTFVRFDLNEPGHENEEREIRSHMHPSNDDLLVPAPVMGPEELLDVLIRRLRAPRGDEKPRE
ncbi:hypothetical protein ACNOYE_01155 [Nannocystaceae bacterium ST9]